MKKEFIGVQVVLLLWYLLTWVVLFQLSLPTELIPQLKIITLVYLGSAITGGFLCYMFPITQRAVKEFEIFSIEKQGLYDKDDKSLVGRVAFIFDGCIVSGWCLDSGDWEANSDVGRHGVFSKEAIKFYVIFDKPMYVYESELTK